MGDEVKLIDTGAEAAIYAKKRLEENDMLCNRQHGSAQYYVSDSVNGFSEWAGMFLDKKIDGAVHKIDIESY